MSARDLDLINDASSIGAPPARDDENCMKLELLTGTSATRGDLSYIYVNVAEIGYCCCCCDPNDICYVEGASPATGC